MANECGFKRVSVPSPEAPGWKGPDITANWRRLREAQAVAVANTPQEPARDQLDIFARCELAEARVRELEKQVEALTAELAKQGSPHLRNRETR